MRALTGRQDATKIGTTNPSFDVATETWRVVLDTEWQRVNVTTRRTRRRKRVGQQVDFLSLA